MKEGAEISAQSPSPVDIGFRPQAPNDVRNQVPSHERQGEACRHRTLADQINGIDDLRVAEALAADPPGLQPEMHAQNRADADENLISIPIRDLTTNAPIGETIDSHS